ncbi:hypothetical protein [cf. Phormidesmis sp. LEGE 11477]|uniref:hypothetical protein n=1 Tax=cf. Phormidesmis sp. LEGE 11477 TaxID=1828680 RepID=UPI00187F5DFC|nr:hypothetical protein [cf. Phormidesmis sp. LEGE 11477]MBE9059616.1 hypothetical protein [cf. Phormidesmis sp. LEGE 11477]
MQKASRIQSNFSAAVSLSVDSPIGQTSQLGQTSGPLPARSKQKKSRKNALSRVLMLASATALVPFASKSAIANSFANAATPSYDISQHLDAVTQPAQTPQAFNQSQAIAPQVDQVPPVSFSHSSALASASEQLSPAVANTDSSWSLSYATQANTAQTNSAVQLVIAKVASDTRRAKSCVDDSCRRLTYIRSQLPAITAKVQRLEEQLKDFSRQHGQGDISAYKTALGDRIAEVSGQERQLDIELDQTHLRVERLTTQLSFANVAAGSAEDILAEDANYQALWQQLVAVEENIQKEYSQVNADGTALNQLYGEYQTLLGKTQTAAREVLSRYMTAGNQIAGLTNYAKIAVETYGDLLVETHQQRVQQLRQRKLAALEIGLSSRQQRLSSKIGEYESLQRELNAERTVLDSYHSERDSILAASPESAPGSTIMADGTPVYNAQSMTAAQTLLPLLPNGSVAKTLLGVAIASSMVAAASHRRAEKKAATLGKRILEILPTSHTASQTVGRQTVGRQVAGRQVAGRQLAGRRAVGRHSVNSRAVNSRTVKRVKTQPQMISLAALTKEPQAKVQTAEAIEIADVRSVKVESVKGTEVAVAKSIEVTNNKAIEIVDAKAVVSKAVDTKVANTKAVDNKAIKTPDTKVVDIKVVDPTTVDNKAIEIADTKAAELQTTEIVDSETIEIVDPKAIEIVESEDSLEVLFATEEMPAKGASFCIVNDLGEFEISESAVQSLDELVPELKADEFKQARENLTSEDLLAPEVDSLEVTPVQLSVEETGLFLDNALGWVIDDLGLVDVVAAEAETDKAAPIESSVAESEVAKPEVTKSEVVGSEAVDLAALDSVAPASVVGSPMVESSSATISI